MLVPTQDTSATGNAANNVASPARAPIPLGGGMLGKIGGLLSSHLGGNSPLSSLLGMSTSGPAPAQSGVSALGAAALPQTSVAPAPQPGTLLGMKSGAAGGSGGLKSRTTSGLSKGGSALLSNFYRSAPRSGVI